MIGLSTEKVWISCIEGKKTEGASSSVRDTRALHKLKLGIKLRKRKHDLSFMEKIEKRQRANARDVRCVITISHQTRGKTQMMHDSCWRAGLPACWRI